MILTTIVICSALLSIERISYFLIWRHPEAFNRLCQQPLVALVGEPVDVLQKLFYLFKVIQVGVFLGWCVVFSPDGIAMPSNHPLVLGLAGALLSVGLFLNASVFHRLGKVGVFYGNKLGHEVPWVHGFPFSVLNHPQYVGTLLNIWGFFLLMRFPHPDWVILPIIETIFYAIGARYER